MKTETDVKTNPCPEFPWFGAWYPDARCIDGFLWDMDSCDDDPNTFHNGGDMPCPFCNRESFIEYHLDEDNDVARADLEKYIAKLQEKYGYNSQTT